MKGLKVVKGGCASVGRNVSARNKIDILANLGKILEYKSSTKPYKL